LEDDKINYFSPLSLPKNAVISFETRSVSGFIACDFLRRSFFFFNFFFFIVYFFNQVLSTIQKEERRVHERLLTHCPPIYQPRSESPTCVTREIFPKLGFIPEIPKRGLKILSDFRAPQTRSFGNNNFGKRTSNKFLTKNQIPAN
jgi:preprotein translocase subunit SecG